MSFFEFDFKNLGRDDILKILGVALVTVSLIAGLISSGGLLTGDLGGAINGEGEDNGVAQTPTEEPPECVASDNNLLGFVPILNAAIKTLNESEINFDELEDNATLLLIADGVFSLENSISSLSINDCTEITTTSNGNYDINFELIEGVNLAIEEINQSLSGCAECETVALNLLNLEFTCGEDKVYDNESKSCITSEPVECKLKDEYDLLKSANDILLNFRSNPTSFGSIQKNQLDGIFTEVEISELIPFAKDDFNYVDDAEELSILLNSLVTQIKNSEPICSQLESLTLLTIPVQNRQDLERPDSDVADALNRGTACPTNSEFDTMAGACYCPLSDSYIERDGICALTQTVAEAPEGVLCADGSIATSAVRCPESNQENEVDDLELEDIFSQIEQVDLPGEENEQEDQSIPLDLIDEEPLVSSGATETTQTDMTSIPSITSNTNANVLGAGVVQGDTGPKITVVMLIGLLLNLLFLKFSKKTK